LIKRVARVWNRRSLYLVESPVALHTYIAFGVVDRGTNVLQVRPTTLCPLNCIFCSVDAGPYSRNRVAEFIVDFNTMVETFSEMARYKSGGLEALIDTIGEGLTYPRIFDLISALKKNPLVSSVALETHGALLTKQVVEKLWEAGLDRVNLSIDTLNPEKARFLTGTSWYSLERVVEVAEYIVRETSIDLHVTPLWIPGVNDEDVVKVVEWAYRIGAGKKWPPATIQKYVVHKYGRRVPGVKPLSWSEFWERIRKFEERYGLRVLWSMSEWGMRYQKRYPCRYSVGDKILVKVEAPGVFRGEFIGLDYDNNGVVAVVGREIGIGKTYLAEVIENKDCLVIARVIKETHI